MPLITSAIAATENIPRPRKVITVPSPVKPKKNKAVPINMNDRKGIKVTK